MGRLGVLLNACRAACSGFYLPLEGAGRVFPVCGCLFLRKALPEEGAHAMSLPLSVAPEPWPGNLGGGEVLGVGTTSVENVRGGSGASVG